MKQYHKIQTVYLRDPDNNHKTLLEGQYAKPEFEYLAGCEWVATEKVDGTNIRIKCAEYQEDGKAYGVTFGGKSDNAQIPAFLIERLEARFHGDSTREQIAELFPEGACLYGEGYGAKIQKGGGNYREDQDFVLFDVKVGEWWLNRDAVEQIASDLKIEVVPIIKVGTLPEMVEFARAGFNSNWGPFLAEGVVARPSTELSTRSGHRIITKIKHKDFVR